MDIAAQIIGGLVVAGLAGVAAVGWKLNNTVTRLTMLVRELQREQERIGGDVRELHEWRRRAEVDIERLRSARNGRARG